MPRKKLEKDPCTKFSIATPTSLRQALNQIVEEENLKSVNSLIVSVLSDYIERRNNSKNLEPGSTYSFSPDQEITAADLMNRKVAAYFTESGKIQLTILEEP